jgi:hypothetical protein
VELRFNSDSLLVGYNMRAEWNGEQVRWFLHHFPRSHNALVQLQEHLGKSVSVTELVREVSFEEFWKRYFAGRSSDNSSKKKSEIRWNRMTKAEQLLAYNHVPRYLNKIPAGVGVKLAETYLNSEVWN